MPGHLIAASIGSPHDFIASGRRMRDIWFGSHLLASLTLAVAQRLSEIGATVIVPCLPDPAKKENDIATWDGKKPARNSNTVIAWLPGVTIERAYEESLSAVNAQWRAIVRATEVKVSPLLSPALWESQTAANPVDLYFASAPLASDLADAKYPEALQRAVRALASHKLQRQFGRNPSSEHHSAVPKSSLDGLGESVLVSRSSRQLTRQHRTEILEAHRELDYLLRLGQAEELDAIGLIKRTAVGLTLPSVTRIAVDPWVRGTADKSPELRALLLKVADIANLHDRGPSHHAISSGVGDNDQFSRFPHDGRLLLQNEIDNMRRDLDTKKKERPGSKSIEESLRNLDRISPLVQKLHDKAGAPDPYYAVISADGDRIGDLIKTHATNHAAHQAISRSLLDYATAAVGIIEEDNNGKVIYAGGEDLLALVPLDQVFGVARKLIACFEASLRDVRPGCTLSVGIAIAHCKDAFDATVQAARDSEHAAKQARDIPASHCAVHWLPRSGADFRLVGRHTLLDRLEAFAELHRHDQMADAIGYKLLQLSAVYDGWETVGRKHEARTEALQLELHRQLTRRKAKGDTACIVTDALATLLAEQGGDTHVVLRHLGQTLVLARRIAHAKRQAEPKAETAGEPA